MLNVATTNASTGLVARLRPHATVAYAVHAPHSPDGPAARRTTPRFFESTFRGGEGPLISCSNMLDQPVIQAKPMCRQTAPVSMPPSRCHENQPLGVLESFCCGVPVVGTRLGGIPKLITRGVNGALVPPNDPNALAMSIDVPCRRQTRVRDEGSGARHGRRRVLSRRHLTVWTVSTTRRLASWNASRRLL
jgi:hypothetical protein